MNADEMLYEAARLAAFVEKHPYFFGGM